MPPGSAMLSSRAAMLTPSPKMSWGSTITSPILTPTRNTMRLSSTSPSCKFANTRLELYRSSNGFDRARKLRQEPVAGVLHDAAAVFGDCRGVRRPLGARPVWHGSPLRHGALTANSQLRRRPISQTTSARPGLAAPAPWPTIQSRCDCTTDQMRCPSKADVAYWHKASICAV